MAMTIEETIYLQALLFFIILAVNFKYPKNYYFSALFLFTFTWCEIIMINMYTTLGEHYIFPLMLLLWNVFIQIFMLLESAPMFKGMKGKAY